MRCVQWNYASEAKEALELLKQWAQIDIADVRQALL